MDAHYLPRSPTPEDFYPFVWTGVTQEGPVQSGTYTLRMEGLRTLGDPENPDHWDVWESPEFELAVSQAEERAQRPVPSSKP